VQYAAAMQKFDYVLFVVGTAMTLIGSVALCAQVYEMRHAYNGAVFGPPPSALPRLAGAGRVTSLPCGSNEASR
jgi:hypothetical protein